MAPQTSSAHLIHTSWVGWSYFTWGRDAHWLLEEPSLHPASFPFWLLQALSNWLTLGFARSSARLAASPWLHWITWNGSLRNNRLKGSQHCWSFLSPSQHSSASCHGRLCSLCVKSLFSALLQFSLMSLVSASPPRQITLQPWTGVLWFHLYFWITKDRAILPFSVVRFLILHLN